MWKLISSNPFRLAFYFLMWVFAALTARELWTLLLTLPAFLIVIYNVIQIRSKNLSTDDMLWFCMMMFFVVSPCQSINDGYFSSLAPAGNKVQYKLPEMYAAMGIVLIWLLGFTFGNARFFAPKKTKKQRIARNVRMYNTDIYLLLISGFIGTVGYIFFSGGLGNVLASRRHKESVEIVAYGFLAAQVTSTILISVIVNKSWKFDWGFLLRSGQIIILLICYALMFLCLNIWNCPRFIFLGSWLPVAFALFGGKVNYKTSYIALFIGIIIVMPILSITSRSGTDALNDLTFGRSGGSAFQVQEVDLFDTLVHAVYITKKDGFMWGANITAILLFFVPRNFWHQKPIVGGLVVGNDLHDHFGAGTPNLSFFIGGDAYLDFGYIGVAVIAVLVGVIWARVRHMEIRYLGINVPDLVLLGFIPILVRGPVGAIIGYLVCMICCLFLLYTFFKGRMLAMGETPVVRRRKA
ncbi:hypothetical protein JIN85_10530 [Luteolibacter pohnpeiensis]|uniref:O-antigen polysaccharide polymerase Wzy n=1 Tax=Luteolibacter pohnpeiensis TaxID=454153 RepID=A0A934S6P6_9BACT|nr:hypothetical protein [Luteolibacter pohnpeiensis]MBK1882853.1 hypothetical protein [Luteolibacter pohnpeiensis]